MMPARLDQRGMGMNQGGMGMQRGRGRMGRGGEPVKRSFSRGMGDSRGNRGGPPPKWLRIDQSGLLVYNNN